MKKIIGIVLLLLSNTAIAFGQSPSNSYSFSSITAPYQKLRADTAFRVYPLIGKGAYPNAPAWSNFLFSIDSPFPITFFNYPSKAKRLDISNLNISKDRETDDTIDFYCYFSFLRAFEGEMCDKNYDKQKGPNQELAVSAVNYATHGSVGKRIFKIEYDNFRFIKSRRIDSMFVQMWIYEEDNSIEFRYGPSVITTPFSELTNNSSEQGYEFGIKLYDFIAGATVEGLFLKDDVRNPTMYRYDIDNPGPPHLLKEFPPNGMVYRFTPTKSVGISLKNLSKNTYTVYPNPASDRLVVQKNSAEYAEFQLIDMWGKTILRQVLSSAEITLDLSEYPAGMYLARFVSTNQSYTTKLQIN